MDDLLDKAQAFYGKALSDPVAACEEFLAENFVLENFLPEPIPFGGRYEGAKGFLRYLNEITESLEMGPLKFLEWVADQRSVVVRGEEESLVRSTRRTYRMRFVHWLTFDDEGRISHMREFNDTASMAEAFEANG